MQESNMSKVAGSQGAFKSLREYRQQMLLRRLRTVVEAYQAEAEEARTPDATFHAATAAEALGMIELNMVSARWSMTKELRRYEDDMSIDVVTKIRPG
jgi:hypothetical protein